MDQGLAQCGQERHNRGIVSMMKIPKITDVRLLNPRKRKSILSTNAERGGEEAKREEEEKTAKLVLQLSIWR